MVANFQLVIECADKDPLAKFSMASTDGSG
jgi:hypothetical protein